MHRSALLRITLVGILALSLGAARSGKLEYVGIYEWYGGDRGRLTVTFMPDGEGRWDVFFRFSHARRFQTWKGTAIGELDDGAVEGLVRGGRYRFAGSFENGVFTGKHFEVNRRGLRESGTLSFE